MSDCSPLLVSNETVGAKPVSEHSEKNGTENRVPDPLNARGLLGTNRSASWSGSPILSHLTKLGASTGA
jgi:hypothetical protein